MKIYQAEINAGLEKQIRSNASIAYTMPTLTQIDNIKSTNIFSTDISKLIAKASAEDDDVFKVYSILVSTSWNKNDDVFSPDEVWAARQTPLYKPTNLEHNEKEIVGSIIGNWPVNREFDLINDNIDRTELPDMYHILVASVIYRQWQDAEYKARAEKLIEEIQSGQKSVSMECIFRGFDYAVESPDRQYHIIARGENTAFLTQHLRAYGGTGVYQDHKVGRLLRNITFSGKGFVANPANPDSVIFNTDRDFPFSKASCTEDLCFNKKGVSISVGENPISKNLQESQMSDYLEKEVAELKTALEASQAEVRELSKQLSHASEKEYQARITDLESSLASIETEKQSFVVVAQKAEEKIASLEASIAELTEKLTQAEMYMKKMEDEKKKEKRMASLIEAGLDSAEAEVQLEAFSSLSDEQFEVFAGMMKKMKAGKTSDDAEAAKMNKAKNCGCQGTMHEGMKDEEDEEDDSCGSVLDSAQVTDSTSLSVASDSIDSEDVNKLQASLHNWVNQLVNKK